MGKIKSILFSALLFFSSCAPAYAALTEPDRSLIRPRNLLTNPGFESGLSAWTSSGGTFVITTTAANVGNGNASGAWDSNSSAQTLTSSAITIPPGMYGQNAVARCNIQTPSGTATHTIAAWDGTTLYGSTTVNSSTNYTPTSLNFVMPATGTIAIRITSVASNEPNINIDDCYIGLADNVGISSDISSFASYTPTMVGFGTTTSVSFYYRRDGDSVEIIGGFTSGTNTGTEARIPLPPNLTSDPTKISAIRAVGDLSIGSALSNSFKALVESGVTYLTVGGQNSTSGALTKRLGTDLTNSVVYTVHATVPIQGWAATGTFSPTQIPASWSGYDASISGGCSTTSATYADPSACTSIALTQTTARNISCSAAASSAPGISCTLARLGMHKVCALTQVSLNTATAGVSARLVDGSATIIDPGRTETISTSGGVRQVSLCGTYNAASLSPTFKVQLAASANTASITNGTATGSGAIQWTIDELDAPLAAPFLTGSVTSITSGTERVERANFGTTAFGTACSASPCNFLSQSGGWLTNVTRTGTGAYSLNIVAGEYSATPSCSFSCQRATNSGTICFSTSGASWSSTLVTLACTDTSNTAADAWCSVICMGPH